MCTNSPCFIDKVFGSKKRVQIVQVTLTVSVSAEKAEARAGQSLWQLTLFVPMQQFREWVEVDYTTTVSTLFPPR